MAKVLIGSELGSYSFDKTTKKITFSGFNASLERILLITDVTNNTVIYQFNDPNLGGVLSNNVLTLTYNTTIAGFSNTDTLQIFYWSEQPQQSSIEDLAMSIKRDLQMISRDPNMTTTGMNVNINAGTLPTVTTVSTVTSLTYLGTTGDGAYGALLHKAIINDAWINYKNKIIS
jgi:hypothetical protein